MVYNPLNAWYNGDQDAYGSTLQNAINSGQSVGGSSGLLTPPATNISTSTNNTSVYTGSQPADYGQNTLTQPVQTSTNTGGLLTPQNSVGFTRSNTTTQNLTPIQQSILDYYNTRSNQPGNENQIYKSVYNYANDNGWSSADIGTSLGFTPDSIDAWISSQGLSPLTGNATANWSGVSGSGGANSYINDGGNVNTALNPSSIDTNTLYSLFNDILGRNPDQQVNHQTGYSDMSYWKEYGDTHGYNQLVAALSATDEAKAYASGNQSTISPSNGLTATDITNAFSGMGYTPSQEDIDYFINNYTGTNFAVDVVNYIYDKYQNGTNGSTDTNEIINTSGANTEGTNTGAGDTGGTNNGGGNTDGANNNAGTSGSTNIGIGIGIDSTGVDYSAQDVTGWYRQMLGRDPEQNEIDYWTNSGAYAGNGYSGGDGYNAFLAAAGSELTNGQGAGNSTGAINTGDNATVTGDGTFEGGTNFNAVYDTQGSPGADGTANAYEAAVHDATQIGRNLNDEGYQNAQKYLSSFAYSPETTGNVTNRIEGLLNPENPILKKLVTQSDQAFNQRGLLNSSMAVGAGQSAMLDHVLDMAKADTTADQFNATQKNNAYGQMYGQNAGLISSAMGSDAAMVRDGANTTNQMNAVSMQHAQNLDTMAEEHGYDLKKLSAEHNLSMDQIGAEKNAGIVATALAAISSISAADMTASEKGEQIRNLLGNTLSGMEITEKMFNGDGIDYAAHFDSLQNQANNANGQSGVDYVGNISSTDHDGVIKKLNDYHEADESGLKFGNAANLGLKLEWARNNNHELYQDMWNALMPNGSSSQLYNDPNQADDLTTAAWNIFTTWKNNNDPTLNNGGTDAPSGV